MIFSLRFRFNLLHAKEKTLELIDFDFLIAMR
jgi:hypothetical protein